MIQFVNSHVWQNFTSVGELCIGGVNTAIAILLRVVGASEVCKLRHHCINVCCLYFGENTQLCIRIMFETSRSGDGCPSAGSW